MADNLHEVPKHTWDISFDAKPPPKSVHKPAVPPITEIITLLPVAYRIGNHITTERKEGREPIFDLNGIALQPPNPGPYAGVPCGGVGSGAIGRGYRGDFRRWSLHPGRYIHRIVPADVFCVRVKRNGKIYSQVLSVIPFEKSSCLNEWKGNVGNLDPSKIKYKALFPRSWTIYEEPVPGIIVTIMQISPFLPHSYSDTSLPVTVFHVDIKNITSEELDVSVMFSFQNGDGGLNDANGSNIHTSFMTNGYPTPTNTAPAAADDASSAPVSAEVMTSSTSQSTSYIIGINQAHVFQTAYTPTPTNNTTTTTSTKNQSNTPSKRHNHHIIDANVPLDERPHEVDEEDTFTTQRPSIDARTINGVHNYHNTNATNTTTNNNNNNNSASSSIAGTGAGAGENNTTRNSWYNNMFGSSSNSPRSPSTNGNGGTQEANNNRSSMQSQNSSIFGGGSNKSKREICYDQESFAIASILTIPHSNTTTTTTGNTTVEGTGTTSVQTDSSNNNNNNNNNGSQPHLNPNSHSHPHLPDGRDQGGGAAVGAGGVGVEEDELTYCSQYITEIIRPSSYTLEDTLFDIDERYIRYANASATELWTKFITTGSISDCYKAPVPDISKKGMKTASALCLRKKIKPYTISNYPFALAWDCPIARFGSGLGLPKYYTRFWGMDGLSASKIASYALLYEAEWTKKIIEWQTHTIQQMDTNIHIEKVLNEHKMKNGKSRPIGDPTYYKYQLFNELYFLVDGGCVWLDSSEGRPNQLPTNGLTSDINGVNGVNSINIPHGTQNENNVTSGSTTRSSDISMMTSESLILNDIRNYSYGNKRVSTFSTTIKSFLSIASLQQIHDIMHKHDDVARNCAGDQNIVGQYLYLEGHEYYMYNTYDVHFYAGYALLMLFPQLELSMQKDYAWCVPRQDTSIRNLMYNGKPYPRKLYGCVPHDLGSPSDRPIDKVNAYNFQDVSNWKDLGPKFVLQIYRDYYFIVHKDPTSPLSPTTNNTTNTENTSTTDTTTTSTSNTSHLNKAQQGLRFLDKVYAALILVMKHTLEYDKDGDGMIENTGFPDQTYDVWIAKGIHAYCGGLWLTALLCMIEITTLKGDDTNKVLYQEIYTRAQAVYIKALWNGTYLSYDNSTSNHHDSIMADMLAGHWFCRACNLISFLNTDQVISCLSMIYEFNVIKFGGKKFLGAVNGMRPNGSVDKTCLQSKEVWTGTTYGLAATMLHEARYYESLTTKATTTTTTVPSIPDTPPVQNTETSSPTAENDPDSTTTTPSPTTITVIKDKQEIIMNTTEFYTHRIAELQMMAFNTAQGIHDGGWKEFGYWFATPEAWDMNGHYRSLGYMRPLSIWAMQYAIEHNCTP